MYNYRNVDREFVPLRHSHDEFDAVELVGTAEVECLLVSAEGTCFVDQTGLAKIRLDEHGRVAATQCSFHNGVFGGRSRAMADERETRRKMKVQGNAKFGTRASKLRERPRVGHGCSEIGSKGTVIFASYREVIRVPKLLRSIEQHIRLRARST